MAEVSECLVIVSRDEPELYVKLSSVFADDPRVVVRSERRIIRPTVFEAAVFPVGRGELAAGLRAYVEDRLRQVLLGGR